MRERGADPLGDGLRALDLRVAEVEHAEDDDLGRQLGQLAEVEPRLGRLDRDLVGHGVAQLAQEVVAVGALLAHQRRVAEAQVHGRGDREPFQGAIDRAHGDPAGRRGIVAKPRLVQLDDVRAGALERVRLGVDRRGQIHHQLVEIVVGLVPRLLGHRERARQGDLDRAVGVRAQELDVAHLDRAAPAHGGDDPRHGPGLARAGQHRGRRVCVDAVECRGEPVRVALAADLAVGDGVDPRAFHVADRDNRRVILRLGQERLGHPPGVARAHARDRVRAERIAIDQPLWLRVAPDHGAWQRLVIHGDGDDNRESPA